VQRLHVLGIETAPEVEHLSAACPRLDDRHVRILRDKVLATGSLGVSDPAGSEAGTPTASESGSLTPKYPTAAGGACDRAAENAARFRSTPAP
jgi:hypothetical protein